jgi:hypothetical protein
MEQLKMSGNSKQHKKSTPAERRILSSKTRSTNTTPSSKEAITRVPSPLVKKTRRLSHSFDEPLPRDPFDTFENFIRITYTVIENPIVSRTPN